MSLRTPFARLVSGRRQPLRFLVAGGINTAFGLSFYPALQWASPLLRQHYLVALGIAQASGITVAFVMYKLLVFRSGGMRLREIGTFASYYVFNYAVNWLVLPFMVEVVRLPPVVAQFGFAVFLLIGSYFWHSRVTFRDRRPIDG